MRYHTLIAVSTAVAGVLARSDRSFEENREIILQPEVPEVPQVVPISRATDGTARSALNVFTRITRPASSDSVFVRGEVEHERSDEGNWSDDSGEGPQSPHYNEDYTPQDHTGDEPTGKKTTDVPVLVGGVLGGIVPAAFLLFLWYWLMYRPKRQEARVKARRMRDLEKLGSPYTVEDTSPSPSEPTALSSDGRAEDDSYPNPAAAELHAGQIMPAPPPLDR